MSTEALAQRILSVIAMDVSRVTAVVERSRKKWAECYTVGAYRKAVCDVINRAVGSAAAQSESLAATARILID